MYVSLQNIKDKKGQCIEAVDRNKFRKDRYEIKWLQCRLLIFKRNYKITTSIKMKTSNSSAYMRIKHKTFNEQAARSNLNLTF